MNHLKSNHYSVESIFWNWLMAATTLIVLAMAIPAFAADVFIDEGDSDFENQPVQPVVEAQAKPEEKPEEKPQAKPESKKVNRKTRVVKAAAPQSKKRLPASQNSIGGKFVTTTKECALESSPGAGDSQGITKAPRKIWVEEAGSETHWKVYNKTGQANFLNKNCF